MAPRIPKVYAANFPGRCRNPPARSSRTRMAQAEPIGHAGAQHGECPRNHYQDRRFSTHGQFPSYPLLNSEVIWGSIAAERDVALIEDEIYCRNCGELLYRIVHNADGTTRMKEGAAEPESDGFRKFYSCPTCQGKNLVMLIEEPPGSRYYEIAGFIRS